MYERRAEGPEEKRSGISPVLIALIVLGALALVFVLQNGDEHEVNFLSFDFTAPTWLVLVLAIAVGVLLDRLFLYWWRRRRHRNA